MAACNAPHDASASASAQPSPCPSRLTQWPSPRCLVRGTNRTHRNAHLGADVVFFVSARTNKRHHHQRAATASARGSRNQQWQSPRWTGPWMVCSPQIPLTSSFHGWRTSCACLCDIGPATPKTTGCIFSPLHQATGLRCFSSFFYGFLHSAQFLPDQGCNSCLRFLAGRLAAALGLPDTRIRRTESSGRLLASFGGLQHFQGPHILHGRPSSPA